MADYDGNGLAAFNDARSRGWGGSVTLADLEKLSAGNPIAHGIAAVWPDAPPSRMDQAYQTSIDRWKQLGKDAFFAPANSLKAFMDQPTFNNALGVMPMGGIGKMPIGPPTGIRAYHGSPYDFDRFDLSKIGTGEGAQSYGHGLYFAENPKVAESYKMTGDARFNRVTTGSMTPHQEFAHDLASSGRSEMDIIGSLAQKYGGHLSFEDASRIAKEASAARGKMYEVNINAKPEQFLDWDRPSFEQSPNVKAALDRIGYFGEGRPASEGYRKLSSDYGGAASGSDAIRDAGIPGIRYLDQGSRGMEGKGTSNYVLFNDKIVDIMKKWSLAGAIPFAAANEYDGRF